MEPKLRVSCNRRNYERFPFKTKRARPFDFERFRETNGSRFTKLVFSVSSMYLGLRDRYRPTVSTAVKKPLAIIRRTRARRIVRVEKKYRKTRVGLGEPFFETKTERGLRV